MYSNHFAVRRGIRSFCFYSGTYWDKSLPCYSAWHFRGHRRPALIVEAHRRIPAPRLIKGDKFQRVNVAYDVTPLIGLIQRDKIHAGRIEYTVAPDDVIGTDKKFAGDRLADIFLQDCGERIKVVFAPGLWALNLLLRKSRLLGRIQIEAIVIAGLRERVVVTVHSNTPSIMIGGNSSGLKIGIRGIIKAMLRDPCGKNSDIGGKIGLA